MERAAAPPQPPTLKKTAKKKSKKQVCAAERNPVKDPHQVRLGGATEQIAAVLRDKNGLPIITKEMMMTVISNCRSPRPAWELVDLENSLTPAEQYLCETQPPPVYAPAEVRSRLSFTRVLGSFGNCYYANCRRVTHTTRPWSLCGYCRQECDSQRPPLLPPTPTPTVLVIDVRPPVILLQDEPLPLDDDAGAGAAFDFDCVL